jgi:hypothetical protein
MDTYGTNNPARQDMEDADLSEQELNTVAGGMGGPPGPATKEKPAGSGDPGPTPFGGLQPWSPPNPTDPPEYGGSGDPRDPDPNRQTPPATF